MNNTFTYHIFSPYRVCPIGAHVDHQHGLVTGFAIDKGVDLWFNIREDATVNLSSRSLLRAFAEWYAQYYGTC